MKAFFDADIYVDAEVVPVAVIDRRDRTARLRGKGPVERDVLGTEPFEALVERIARREVDPYTAASDILSRALKHS